MYKKVTIPLNGMYPKVFVNSAESVFAIRNASVDLRKKTYNRLMFVACDSSGYVVPSESLNRKFDRGLFCP